MAKLLFFDEGHVYKIGDETLPSVSEITRFISAKYTERSGNTRLTTRQTEERGYIRLVRYSTNTARWTFQRTLYHTFKPTSNSAKSIPSFGTKSNTPYITRIELRRNA